MQGAFAECSLLAKHQIIIQKPWSHRGVQGTSLVIRNAHEHVGVKGTLTETRRRFWIVKGQSLVRSLIHQLHPMQAIWKVTDLTSTYTTSALLFYNKKITVFIYVYWYGFRWHTSCLLLSTHQLSKGYRFSLSHASSPMLCIWKPSQTYPWRLSPGVWNALLR